MHCSSVSGWLRTDCTSAAQITIHTRKADEDILPILKEELPKEQRLHIHW